MDFERKFKNKTILTVLFVLFVLCTIYFILGYKNQKQYINWQIQKDNEIVNLEIKRLFQTTNQLYRDKIQFCVNNPEMKKAFYTNNTENLYKKLFPVYS